MPGQRSWIRPYERQLPYLQLALDLLLIVINAVIAFRLRFEFSYFQDNARYLLPLLLALPAAAIYFPLFNLYDSWRGRSMIPLMLRVAAAWGLTIATTVTIIFALHYGSAFSRLWFTTWAIGTLYSFGLLRLLWVAGLQLMRHKGWNERRLLIVGAGDLGQVLADRLANARWTGLRVVGFLDDNPELEGQNYRGIPITANVDQIEDWIGRFDAHEVWLALPLRAQERVQEILHLLRHSTITIRLIPDVFSFRLINHGFTEVLGVPLIDLNATPMMGSNRFIKAIEDKVLAGIILLLASPVMIAIAIAIKLTSPGPIFYRQERIGWNGQPFMMLKFRSMPVNSEAGGVQWGKAYAKPTTPLGGLLRRTSLDELPQFINVLRGEMSIVGPRPERSLFVEQFKDEIPDYMKKHMVKAGITGWAQVNGLRGDTDLRKRIEYDLYYIENWSLAFDLKIIGMTLLKGFVSRNAY
ncbi:undecaprenyl-phosphate glucose phosphotransferase [Synechococcus elongatus]|uniref:Undecaprenyl-phosphate glucose phosphotransferase n=1 Tax=Synechococcus elongatus PCC 11801 TaxID=2219813 RepID=A0AAN1QNC5_SYNEL|nr:undecaprenyl-phosphate glucose phosphotransferase [Synechococcus elongatus]AZB72368.1 undecaprenyl-phosphate glucose phosphotransferase [Synechococcus elongatus PCC 11801]